MQVDKDLCNKILTELSNDYPSRMSYKSFENVSAGITDGDHLSKQFAYLEGEGYLETKLTPIANDDGSTTQQIQLALTKITHEGMDVVRNGGIK